MKSSEYRALVGKYLYGFVVSIVLTLLAYWFVVEEVFATDTAIAVAILLLAVVQFAVQAWYFLHLGEETRPRWKGHVFVFTLGMMLIIVAGSLWVIFNMNYNMNMSPEAMETYMLEQNKKGF